MLHHKQSEILLVLVNIILTSTMPLYSFWRDWRYTLKRARLQGTYESVFSESLHLKKKNIHFFVSPSRLMLNSCWQLRSTHTLTFCTKWLEAHRHQPDRVLRGQVQPALTAAAWNPLQQGGQGYTIPAEQQYDLDSHVDTAQLWIQAGLKINLQEADLWLLAQCCFWVHLCSRFKVSMPVTPPLIQQVAQLCKGWTHIEGFCLWYAFRKSWEMLSSDVLIYHTCQDFGFGLWDCSISPCTRMQTPHPGNLTGYPEHSRLSIECKCISSI